MKRYRMRFLLEDDVAEWFESRRDKGRTIAEALSICSRLDKLREVLDGLVSRGPASVPTPKPKGSDSAAKKAAALISNVFKQFDGDSD